MDAIIEAMRTAKLRRDAMTKMVAEGAKQTERPRDEQGRFAPKTPSFHEHVTPAPERKSPSFDGGARRTAPIRVTHEQTLIEIIEAERGRHR
jgi:hypothetical protein